LFGILHENVEVAILIEDAGIEQLIFHLVAVTSPVCLQEIGIGKR
jgi:hypothetical protein